MPIDAGHAKELFLAVLELPVHERAAYLDSACAGDAALRQRIESMLQNHENSGELLPRSPAEMLVRGDATEADETGEFPPQSEPTPPDELAFLSPSEKPGYLGRLGHYEIQEVIGKGGFGIVLKAFDAKLHRIVAIKVLSPVFAAIGSARKRFIREARTFAAVKNEHVVAIYGVEDEAQPPYLVMELIDGMSLQDKLEKKGPLSVKEILRIGLQTAEGLAAAHKQGLVHRDIKPANILLENGVERVKITDFGLARAVDDASVTQSGTVAGTPMYMSPEQAEGLAVDHRSDLFSLGTVLYAMCTGHPPFRASGTHAVLKRVIDAAPRPIREINDEIPEWLCAIIAKLHAKKPEDRFQTAKEVAELLGQHLAHVQQPTQAAPLPAHVWLPERAAAGPARWQLGDRVLAPWEPEWLYTGTIREIKENTLLVSFDDGDLDWVKTDDVRPLQIEKNTRVFGFWANVSYYAGTVTERTGDGIHIVYDDGDTEWTELKKIRIASGKKRGTGFVSGLASCLVYFVLFFGVFTLIERLTSVRLFGGAIAAVLFGSGILFALLAQFLGPRSPVHQSVKWLSSITLIGSLLVGLNAWHHGELWERKEAADNLVDNSPAFAIAPFDAAKAKDLEEAWANHLNVEVEITNSVGMKLRLIPPGSFLMGAPDNEPDRQPHDGPQHEVMLTKPFHIGAHAVTVGQFKAFVKESGYVSEAEKGDGAYRLIVPAWRKDPKINWKNTGFAQTDDHPVVCISWNDAQAFCAWLSKQEGRQYALPTEAQWEYACRAGSTTKFAFGNDDQELGEYAWYVANAAMKTHPVGEKTPNAWGLFDMHGNVWQWIEDWFDKDYYKRSPSQDPPGGTGTTRGLRGGGWSDVAARCRAAHRDGIRPTDRDTHVGFRVVLVEFKAKTPPLAVAPFGEKQAKAHQEAWAKHLGVDVEITNSIGMKLRLIPPGEFLMGTSQAEVERLSERLKRERTWFQGYALDRLAAETPQQRVAVTRPFYLGAHEITVAQFRKFVEATGYQTDAEKDRRGGYGWANGQWEWKPGWNWRNPGFPQTEEHPVGNVSWDDAQAFCRWLSTKENAPYRLPTEAEWEYACRAGSATRFHSGDDEDSLRPVANIADASLREKDLSVSWACAWNDGYPFTAPIGRFQPNALGLYDMHGNVWEWCADWYDRSGDHRVFRGGGWDNPPIFCRSADRYSSHAYKLRTNWAGLRVLRAVTDAELKAKTAPAANYALRFDGKTSSVAIPTLKRNDTGSLTIEAWARPDAPDKLGCALVVLGGSTGHCSLEQIRNCWIGADFQLGRQRWLSNSSAPLGKLAHLALVIDTQELRFYVDGTLASRSPRTPLGEPYVIVDHAWIGAGKSKLQPGNTQWHFTGLIDEVRVSKKARYDNNFTPEKRFDPDTDTLALYHFDEGNGDLLKDSSGNGHDGKIVGAKWVKADGSPILAAEQWVPLFNGKDLTGWTRFERGSPRGRWEVKDNILTAADGVDGRCTVRSDFENFHLRIEAKINDGGCLEVQGRFDPNDTRDFFTVPMLTAAHLQQPLGEAWKQTSWSSSLVPSDEWFTFDILAEGDRISVKLNGLQFKEFRAEGTSRRKGRLGLELAPRTVVQFKKIEIKELPVASK